MQNSLSRKSYGNMLLNRFVIFIFFCLFCLAQKFNKIEREREENVSSREKQTMRSENLNFAQAKYKSNKWKFTKFPYNASHGILLMSAFHLSISKVYRIKTTF